MATLQERLDEAETAYHELCIGKALVQFHDSNGETVQYNQANRAALAAYIADLKRQIDPTSVDLSPMRPMFR
jgi:hypothetical protein